VSDASSEEGRAGASVDGSAVESGLFRSFGDDNLVVNELLDHFEFIHVRFGVETTGGVCCRGGKHGTICVGGSRGAVGRGGGWSGGRGVGSRGRGRG